MKKQNPFKYFANSVEHELEFVRKEKKKGGKIVGIYCEYTPREIILAAGAVPVCLCGTSNDTVSAAESVLPANLCPLIKSSFGHFITDSCPFITMADMIVAETTCDGKKKMYEIMGLTKRVEVLELTQKSDSETALKHWTDELRKFRGTLEKEFKVEITDRKLRDAIKTMNRERALLKEAFYLGKAIPPIVTGKELASIRFRVAGIARHLEMLEEFIAQIKARKKNREISARAVRVMLTGCPTGSGSEKVIEIIGECGGVVVCQEACSGIKAVYEMTDEKGDPLEAIARRHFNLPCSCMTPNRGRVELIAKLAEEFRPDAVVDLVWQACHTYNVESYLIGEFSRNMLGLPFLKIETDYSASDREQLRVRIGALLEIAGKK
ncbi:MAG: double-cubane-cluster-containing anaerobic reductase [Victivallales bacterium]